MMQHNKDRLVCDSNSFFIVLFVCFFRLSSLRKDEARVLAAVHLGPRGALEHLGELGKVGDRAVDAELGRAVRVSLEENLLVRRRHDRAPVLRKVEEKELVVADARRDRRLRAALLGDVQLVRRVRVDQPVIVGQILASRQTLWIIKGKNKKKVSAGGIPQKKKNEKKKKKKKKKKNNK
jgi:hypothetical protein